MGVGNQAILPETRLKVDVDAFFRGELKAFALRNSEMALRMNVANANKGDKAIRLYNVLTFDESTEEIEFGGTKFQRRPKPTRSEKATLPVVNKKKKDKETVPVSKKGGKEEVREKRKAIDKKGEMPSSNAKDERRVGRVDRASSSESNNPTLESLQTRAELLQWSDDADDEGQGVQILNDLLESQNILDIRNVQRDGNDESECEKDVNRKKKKMT